MDTIAAKVESLLAWIRPSSSNDNNVIDLQKTFSAAGIDILPVVIKILELEAGFPSSRIQTKEGIKYHELEFFQANISSSSASSNSNSNCEDNHPQDNQNSLFAKLDRTYTTLGSTLLKSIILQPYHNHEQIKNLVMNRQNTVLQLISISNSNPKATNQIHILLENLQKIEQELLAMSLEDTAEMEEVYKIIFFEMGPLKYLNYHSLFLKIFYYFMIIFSPMYGMIAPFVFIFAPFLFMKYILKTPIPLDAFWNIMKKMLFGGTGFMAILDKMFNSQVGAGMQSSLNGGGVSVKGVVFWLVRTVISLLNSSIGGYAYIAFIVASYIYGIYNSLQVSITFNKIINMFHSRMNILAKWLRGCIQLYQMNVCFGSVELAPTLARIRNLLGDELIQMLLGHTVFTQEPGLISDKGVIIKCFRLFLDAKKQGQDIIAPFAKYVAHVDVFMGLSTWLREKDDRCPARFILDASSPTIQGKDIWNLACGAPLSEKSTNLPSSSVSISSKVPIYNDVLLGGESTVSNDDASKEEENEIVSLEDNSNSSTLEEESTLEEKENKQEDIQEDTEEDSKDTEKNIEEGSKDKEENKESKEEIRESSKTSEPIELEPKDKDNETNHNKTKEEFLDGNKNSKKCNGSVNNVIITGPNGSGKSTYIKSIMECVILAQTVGIVPAREFNLTPFAHISTYLNIPDCQGKESLFQAEMNRCYQQLETLRAAEEAGEFSFNIMDEIFVSTNYQEGMSGAYAVINQLCRFNKCLNVITTHFDKLANLEDLKVGRKYFDVEIGEDGNVSRDYKIRDGVSRKHMALKLLRNRGFSDELVKDAETFYEKICK